MSHKYWQSDLIGKPTAEIQVKSLKKQDININVMLHPWFSDKNITNVML